MDSLAKLVENFLYYLASALYLPVILGVALLCLYVTVLLGIFSRDWLKRRHKASEVLLQYQALLEHTLADIRHQPEATQQAHVERLLQACELQQVSELDKVRFIIRTGPALGLMGTLIPMGTSLSALAEGNIPNMASNMVTAFTATVAGLGCSVLAYLIALAREKWLRADIREMEFHTELVMQQKSAEHARRVAQDVLAEELTA